MKITQIELPEAIGSAVVVLSHLAEEGNICVVHRMPKFFVEEHGCDPSPRMRLLSTIWKKAIENGTTETIAWNILEGHSALVRVE